MTKARQRHRKKARRVQELEQERARRDWVWVEALPHRELTPEEMESDRILNERLAKKFGEKKFYADFEIEEALSELEAENALPDLSHLEI